MKLIIYETTHFETLPALLVLANKHFEKTTVFLTEQSYNQLLPSFAETGIPNNVHFEIQDQGTSNRKFIRMFFRHLRSERYSHLHINTLEHNVLYFAIKLMRVGKIHISITVHMINEYRTFSFGGLKKITESMAKVILHSKIDRHRVLAPAMVNYFHSRFTTKRAMFIPGNFYDAQICKPVPVESGVFTIAIPGSVEAKRKDYDFVVRFFAENMAHFTQFGKIKLILMGSADSKYGRGIVAQLQNLENDRFAVQWFEKEIDQPLYNQLYCGADIIWSPIVVQTKGIRNVPETSSVSISPGFFIDQMHFGKPVIVPYEIQVHAVLKDCNFKYSDLSQLREILIKLMGQPEVLVEKRKQIADACKYFKAENFEASFQKMMSASPA